MSRALKLLISIAILCITALLPGDGVSASRTLTGDLNGNEAPEQYLLAGHRLTVRERETVLWQSPTAWRVDSFSLSDADNDGTVNLVLSLWKEGSFGQVKPFWEDGEDRSFKNHLFVYRLSGSTLRPVWCSSNLDRPIVSFAIRDVDADGRNELVVEEGSYRRVTGQRYAVDETKPARSTVWRWDGWGFTEGLSQERPFLRASANK